MRGLDLEDVAQTRHGGQRHPVGRTPHVGASVQLVDDRNVTTRGGQAHRLQIELDRGIHAVVRIQGDISLDPHNGVDASVELDLEAMGLATPGGHITVVDELDGRSYVWGSSNWVSLSPVTRLGHVFKVEPAHSSPWAQA